MSAMMRPPRSGSRMSVNSKTGGSKASDEDSKTSVRVGMLAQLTFDTRSGLT